ncbi:MAG: FtsX-like permease family protein, partial [Gemmatimonadetes bacterium]|nr:FtsX-like permease family protein [Gemmatimonadota bacterium]
VALALILLTGAGLVVRSFVSLVGVDRGYRTEGVLAATVQAWDYFSGPDQRRTFARDAVDRLGALPGVTAAGMTQELPVEGGFGCVVQGFDDAAVFARLRDAGLTSCAGQEPTTPGYFEAMGIPVLAGRAFDSRDTEDGPIVAVVNETLVRRFWPERSPLGDGIRQPGGEREFGEIIGVVGDIRHEGLDVEPRPMLYFVHAQSPRTWFPVRGMTLVLRSSVEPTALTSAARREVQAMDPSLPIFRVQTLEQAVADSTSTQRFSMLLQLVFAGVALVLAAVGIYGVISYSVAQRTREIGIRMALGADRGRVLRLVVGQGMTLVGVAVVVGLVVALMAGQVLASLLYGVSPRDPLTYIAVTGVLTLVALAACWIPARRASGVTPQSALRYE